MKGVLWLPSHTFRRSKKQTNMKQYNKYRITIDNDSQIPSVPIAAKILGIPQARLERKLQRAGFSLDTTINDKHIKITIFKI